MFKWIALSVGVVAVVAFVVRIMMVMHKTHKESKQSNVPDDKPSEEYVPQDAQIDLHSSNTSIVTDMSVKPNSIDAGMDNLNGFNDRLDSEFNDYSTHMRKRKGRRRQPLDFDLDGDMADEDLYMPQSPDFDYLLNRKPKQTKKPLNKELNELPTELKVLMLSDIFDRKFFD